MIRRVAIIFSLAFFLNLIWEHLHSVLYVSYQGKAITNFVLFRAAVFDGAVTAFFYVFFFEFSKHPHRTWLLPSALTFFAIGLEMWALTTGRWIYTDVMPIIPFLSVGFTPTIQLGLLGYFSLKVSDFFRG